MASIVELLNNRSIKGDHPRLEAHQHDRHLVNIRWTTPTGRTAEIQREGLDIGDMDLFFETAERRAMRGLAACVWVVKDRWHENHITPCHWHCHHERDDVTNKFCEDYGEKFACDFHYFRNPLSAQAKFNRFL